MKKIIYSLLLACSTLITAGAAETAAPDMGEQPESVIALLKAISNKHKVAGSEEMFSKRNPDTGIIEARVYGCKFVCFLDDEMMKKIPDMYKKDEHCSYQMIHEVPSRGQTWSADVGESRYYVRPNATQETWFMCVKNSENPRLRDLYSISWDKATDGLNDVATGRIYMITSPRPDLIANAKDEAPRSKRFTIDVTVDDEIKDSLYNIYIAPYGEQISDDNLIATVPVVNKKATFSIDLDNAVAGRLRCIFPDGELCSAWMEMTFIPGMTLKITVHNGHFDINNRTEYDNMLAQVYLKAKVFNANFRPATLDEIQKYAIGQFQPSDTQEDSKYERLHNEVKIQMERLEFLQQQISTYRQVGPYARDRREAKKMIKVLYKEVAKVNKSIMELTTQIANMAGRAKN